MTRQAARQRAIRCRPEERAKADRQAMRPRQRLVCLAAARTSVHQPSATECGWLGVSPASARGPAPPGSRRIRPMSGRAGFASRSASAMTSAGAPIEMISFISSLSQWGRGGGRALLLDSLALAAFVAAGLPTASPARCRRSSGWRGRRRSRRPRAGRPRVADRRPGCANVRRVSPRSR